MHKLISGMVRTSSGEFDSKVQLAAEYPFDSCWTSGAEICFVNLKRKQK